MPFGDPPSKYYAVYETDTGRLVSISSVLSDPLPSHLTALDIGATQPADNTMWDETSRSFVPRPPKILIDRFQDFLDIPEIAQLWTSLNVQRQTAIRDALIRILGRKRWRSVGTPPEI